MNGPKMPTSLPSKKIWWVLSIPIIFFFGSIGAYRLQFGSALSGDQETWGQFGDYLGGLINPVVGLITIVLLILTLTAQRAELAAQRQELALQRKESQRSADALDAQHKAIQLQSFEQTLFKWFDNYRELIQSIESMHTEKATETTPAERKTLTGQKALRRITTNIYQFSPDIRQKINQDNYDMIWALDQKTVDDFYDNLKRSASKTLENEHLTTTTALRTLYGIFKWIHSNDNPGLDVERKKMYAGIIRAQLSEYELRLLFINGMGKRGLKFVQYANEFAMFDNMLVANTSLINLLLLATNCPYTLGAFGNQKPTAFKKKQERMEKFN